MKVRKQKKLVKSQYVPGQVLYNYVTNTCCILAVVVDVKSNKKGGMLLNVKTVNCINMETGTVAHDDIKTGRYRPATKREKKRYFELMYNIC